jgi:folate-binding Fe-S cluster repair protein YgfZ
LGDDVKMITAHYDAATNHAAVIRQGWMSLLKLTGQERQSWLQGMVTNKLKNSLQARAATRLI